MPATKNMPLSDRAYWAEDGAHRCILSPMTSGDLSMDRDEFGRSFFSSTDKEPLPADLEFADAPLSFAVDGGLYLMGEATRPMDVATLGRLPYRGRVGDPED
ncbi:hypothetical protein N3K63_12675 [Microbacterium sp. W1N]|uniref:hypothetical protein n=1 Tax=Microbacterium festucae TaxID=2977531 RepID=UPI0021BE8178|nr:hypothetical protein [Microbacterium festucae]MCT9821133.1 hypothetical protein [Microbacterium festucae]